MIQVTYSNLDWVAESLTANSHVSLDTETSGLRRFHGDELFSIAMANETEEFYFNFLDYKNPKIPALEQSDFLKVMAKVFNDPTRTYFMHNAKFDLHMLDRFALRLTGIIHCTKSIGRVVYNEHQKYDLDSSLQRIGMEKDNAVERYIEDHHLWEWEVIPGKQKREKRKFFDKVPFDIIMPYACKDARGTYDLGMHQIAELRRLAEETKEANVPSIINVARNERKLTKTVFRMEQLGCKIDLDYCKEAIAYCEKTINETVGKIEFESPTISEFKNSSKCLSEIFATQRHNFTPAEKRGYSFDDAALQKIEHPLVEVLRLYRKAKNRLDFFQGFLYHADKRGIVHPSFNPDVARHGRFSSSSPNFQNLASNEEEDEEKDLFPYNVRRAIIPRDANNILLMPDYSAFEYRMALEYACRGAKRIVPLAQMVLDGMDFHDATIELVKKSGYDISRRKAKVANFLTLYAGGPKAMSEQIGVGYDEAREIFTAIRGACPELNTALKKMEDTAYKRGYIFNWYGRRCFFPNKSYTYKAGNYIISGGCADVAKLAMNRIYDEQIRGMTCMIHDEFVFDVPLAEADRSAIRIKRIMESSFDYKYMPMKVDMAYSKVSLADKVKGMPCES